MKVKTKIVILLLILFSGCSDKINDEREKSKLITTLNNEIRADSLSAYIEWLEGMGTRFTFGPSNPDNAIKIRDKFAGFGYDNARLDTFFVTKLFRGTEYNEYQYNVTAMIKGSVYPDSICILGAHYDNMLKTGGDLTMIPGANDNASGVAATLEIARVMKKMNYSPECTIMFVAFGAEEVGLLGSRHLAAKEEMYGKIRFMLNNDMIAMEPETNSDLWNVNIMNYPNSTSLRRNAEKICEQYTSLNHYNDNTNNAYSDSYAFFLNGYKALFFYSAAPDPEIHTVNDVSSRCNYEYCREIAAICCGLLVSMN